MARFQEDPRESHVATIKRIFRYLKGTPNHGLWYPKDTNFTLSAYIDVDWVGCVDDKKSTSGGAFFLGCRLVSWLKKKQDSISLSTAKVEYIATTYCCTQLLWMRKTLKDIKVVYDEPIYIFYDNTSALNISKNQLMHSRTKNILI